MREIQASTITDVVEKLCIEANYHLPEDVKCAITGCRACEDGEIAKGVLDKIVEAIAPEIEKRKKKMQAAVNKYTEKYTK